MARSKLDRVSMVPDHWVRCLGPIDGGLGEETADNPSSAPEPPERITADPRTEPLPSADFITAVRSGFGVTREFFARMTGFSAQYDLRMGGRTSGERGGIATHGGNEMPP